MTCSRPIRLGVLTLFVLGLAAAQAAAWGPAVHHFVANHSGRSWPYLNRIEMYGAALPDMCFFVSNPEQLPTGFPEACAAVIHGGEGFPPPFDDQYTQHLMMWEGARTWRAKALGFGYMSHEAADYTAHGEPGAPGYVIVKAGDLMTTPEFTALGVPPAYAAAAAHNLVEVATDVWVKRIDPVIGLRMTLAALLRGPFVPKRLADAYAYDLALAMQMGPGMEPEAAALLKGVEGEFRQVMILYGQIMVQSEEAAILLLAEQFRALAPQFGYEGDPPDAQVIAAAIARAMQVCSDFPAELGATLEEVKENLKDNNIRY